MDPLAELAALERIRQLKYRYFRTLDLKLWDDFADTLAEDVSARYGTAVHGEPIVLDGRDAVVDYMRTNLTDSIITVHIAQHPELTVTGDSAAGSWGFEDTVIVPDFKTLIRGAGYYADRYQCDPDGQWRIASTSYERVYESMQNLGDTPSYQLLANRWA